MGFIRNTKSGDVRTLEPQHYIGRAPNSSLRIDHRLVSAQHALLRWSEEARAWEIRDLGSLNGTYLDGTRLEAGKVHPVAKGMVVSFGPTDALAAWELIDDSPPWVMVVPWDGAPAIPLEDDIVALPSVDDPRVTIYRDDGGWLLERPDESITPIANLQTFDVAGRVWRFCCFDEAAKTEVGEGPHSSMRVQHLRLTFYVSADEETVSVQAAMGSQIIDLGTRAYFYLLLTLARRRLEDLAQGASEDACVWIYVEDLIGGESGSPPQVNIDVYRTRKHVGSLGIEDAAGIIERRPRTQQLRIGVQNITVVRM